MLAISCSEMMNSTENFTTSFGVNFTLYNKKKRILDQSCSTPTIHHLNGADSIDKNVEFVFIHFEYSLFPLLEIFHSYINSYLLNWFIHSDKKEGEEMKERTRTNAINPNTSYFNQVTVKDMIYCRHQMQWVICSELWSLLIYWGIPFTFIKLPPNLHW